MQRYHNETILSSYNTRSAQKRRERLEKTSQILEGYELERSLDEAFENNETKALNENFNDMMNMQNKVAKEKRSHREIDNQIDTFNENQEAICRDIFFYTVYESLLVDDSIKSKADNFNYIRESSDNFFNKMNEMNALSIKEGSAFDDIIHTSMRFLTEEVIENEGVDIRNIIKKTILSESMLTFYAIESIKLKTAECIKNEKKSSAIKESLINEDKYVDPSKSLFRYLFESNIQDVIEKSDEKDPSHLQDLSMLETILDYTILETANTYKLVEFDNELKKVINRK